MFVVGQLMANVVEQSLMASSLPFSSFSTGSQNFVQSVSNLLMEENRERWEEAQLVSWSLSLLLTDSLAHLYAHT